MKQTIQCMMVAAAFPALMFGCASPKMGKYDVAVTPDSGLKGGGTALPRVEVDLVGLNQQSVETWKAVQPDKYFSGGDALRQDSREFTKSFVFTGDAPGAQVLKRDDPIWEVWKKRQVTSMMVLADSRGLKGPASTRMLLLPLMEDQWKVKQIDLVVKPSGVECTTGTVAK